MKVKIINNYIILLKNLKFMKLRKMLTNKIILSFKKINIIIKKKKNKKKKNSYSSSFSRFKIQIIKQKKICKNFFFNG